MNHSPLNNYVYELLNSQLDSTNPNINALSHKLNVSVNNLKNWLSGKFNFSLDEVHYIEEKLGIQILQCAINSNIRINQLGEFSLSLLEFSGLLDQKLRMICHKYKIYTLEDLVRFKITYNSTIKLTANSKYYERQLDNLCRLAVNGMLNHLLDKVSEPAQENGNQSLENTYRTLVGNLSVRSQNVLSSLIKQYKSFDEFYRAIQEIQTGKMKLKNAGAKTEGELINFIFNLERKAGSSNPNNFEVPTDEVHTFANEFKIKIVNERLNNINSDIIDTNVFQLLKFVIEYSDRFNSNFRAILVKFTHRDSIAQNPNLGDVGESLNISRERVRQLKNKIEIELNTYSTSIVKLYSERINNKYAQYLNSTFVYFSSKDSELLNSQEKTEFNTNTYATVLAAFRSDDPFVFGLDDINFILISSNYVDKYNFNQLFDAFKQIHNQNRYDDETLLLSEFIPIFIDIQEEDTKNDFENLLKLFLCSTYNLRTINNEIILGQNTTKSLLIHIEDILEKQGSPMKLSEITQELTQLIPHENYTEGTIRSEIYKNEKIMPIGKSSTYALKAWEDEKIGVLGGTILEMCYNHLLEVNSPMHIYDLYLYVNQYRNTTTRNIATNIKLDPKRRFKSLGNEYYGLLDREYDLESMNIKPISNHLFHKVQKMIQSKGSVPIKELEEFIFSQGNISISQTRYFIHDYQERDRLQIQNGIVTLT